MSTQTDDHVYTYHQNAAQILRVCPPKDVLACLTKSALECPVDDCNRVLMDIAALGVHVNKDHRHDDQEVQYHCPVQSCVYRMNGNRFFSCMKFLKQHYMKVHAEKKFVCDSCNKGFGQQTHLTYHQRTCGLTFCCSACDSKYTSKEALQTHCYRKQHAFPEEYKPKKKQNSKKTKKSTGDPNAKESKQGQNTVMVVIMPPGESQSNSYPALPSSTTNHKDHNVPIQPKSLNEVKSKQVPLIIQTTGNLTISLPNSYGPQPVRSESDNQPVTQTCNDNNRTDTTPNSDSMVDTYSEQCSTYVPSNTSNTQSSATTGTFHSGPSLQEKIIYSRTADTNHFLTQATGTQTLNSQKRNLTVSGTQTSCTGEYILRKAMKAANLPTRKESKGSQVSPRAKLRHSRRVNMHSSETQTTPTSKSRRQRSRSHHSPRRHNDGGKSTATAMVQADSLLNPPQITFRGITMLGNSNTQTQTMALFNEVERSLAETISTQTLESCLTNFQSSGAQTNISVFKQMGLAQFNTDRAYQNLQGQKTPSQQFQNLGEGMLQASRPNQSVILRTQDLISCKIGQSSQGNQTASHHGNVLNKSLLQQSNNEVKKKSHILAALQRDDGVNSGLANINLQKYQERAETTKNLWTPATENKVSYTQEMTETRAPLNPGSDMSPYLPVQSLNEMDQFHRETQTPAMFSAFDDNVFSEQNINYTSMETQTGSDDIINELLSNMETQTGDDLLFPELTLADIQNQIDSGGLPEINWDTLDSSESLLTVADNETQTGMLIDDLMDNQSSNKGTENTSMDVPMDIHSEQSKKMESNTTLGTGLVNSYTATGESSYKATSLNHGSFEDRGTNYDPVLNLDNNVQTSNTIIGTGAGSSLDQKISQTEDIFVRQNENRQNMLTAKESQSTTVETQTSLHTLIQSNQQTNVTSSGVQTLYLTDEATSLGSQDQIDGYTQTTWTDLESFIKDLEKESSS